MPTLLLALVFGTQAAVIDLRPNQDPEDVLSSAWVLVDTTGQMTLEDVRAEPERFSRNTGGIINPGTTRGVVWVRFQVENQGQRAGDWVISLNRALVDPGEIFIVRGEEARTILADSTLAYAGSYEEFGTLAGRFTLEGGESASLYVRYRGGNWSGLTPSITTAWSLRQSVTTDLIVVFALVGGILTLVLHTVVAYSLLDRQIVVLYAVAQITLLFLYLHLSGVTTMYLWPMHPEAGRLVAPLTMPLSTLVMVQFGRKFFDTSIALPGYDKILRSLLIVGIADMGVILISDFLPELMREISLYVLFIVMSAAWLLLPFLAILATLRQDRDNWPLAVGWTLSGGAIIATQLLFAGLFDGVPLREHFYGVIVYVEAVFLALGIALRVRRIRAERVRAEQRLSASLAAELSASERARRFAEEREWALTDLAEKGRLILAAGHDTRQMISSLRHYALGLARRPDPERVRSASRALQQIATSLDDVLAAAISGSASGGIGDKAIALEAVKPMQILDPLKLIYGGLALKKGIELRMHALDLQLVTDRVLTARILGNLLSNALKYTDTGKVLVTCRPHGNGCRFQILDTGHGIEREALDRLMASSTAGMRLESVVDGQGAGLHIAKSLAQRLGGSLHARSTPGRGSCFELRLPDLARIPASSDHVPIIVLDTDDQHARMIADAAEQLGSTQHRCADAARARELLASSQALVLIDEHFGGSTAGLELADSLHGVSEESTIAVMTHDRSVDARVRVTEVTSLMLYKPVTAPVLAAAARMQIP